MNDDRHRPLRILHWPTDVGGHPGTLARAERQIGLDSTVAVIQRGPFGYPVDIDLNLGGRSRVVRLGGRAKMLLQAARHYDIVHLNFGQPFLPIVGAVGIDLPALRLAGKRVFATMQGCDARPPRSCPVCCEGRGPCALAETRHRRNAVRYITRHADAVFCLNPDLLDDCPDSIFMPYACVDPAEIRPVPPAPRDPARRLRIVHAPTNRVIKGTDAVIAAAKALAGRVELRLIEHQSRQEALEAFAQADVIVDQLRLGWYGAVATEAMALGRPVIAHIDPEMLARVPPAFAAELPVVDATTATIEQALCDLADAPAEHFAAIARRSRSFIERWHDPRALASWLGSYYEGRAAGQAFAPPAATEPAADDPRPPLPLDRA